MTGVLVQDANAPNLLAGTTLDSATTSTGTVVDLHWAGLAEVWVDVGTVTGTSNPTLDIQIQESPDADFGTAGNINDLAHFDTLPDTDDAEYVQSLRISERYVRTSIAVTGTNPDFSGATCKIHSRGYRRRGSNPVAGTETAKT